MPLRLRVPSVTGLLKPIGRAVVAFFRHDLALKRSRAGLQLVLKERAPQPSTRRRRRDAQQQAQAERERQALARMLADIDTLLDEQPQSRRALRHLAYVRQALERKGVRVLRKLPLEVLQRALEQLESVVTNWSPVGLADLRSKMAVAIIERERDDPDAEADAYRTAAVLDSKLGVPSSLPDVEVRCDDEALAAAYAALTPLAGQGAVPAASPHALAATAATGAAAASSAAAVRAGAAVPTLDLHMELGSPSARALKPAPPRPTAHAGPIELRVLSD